MNIILGLTFTLAVLSFVLTIFRDIGLAMIFNVDAFLIVIGGTTIALFVGFPVARIRDTVDDVIGAFSKRRDRKTVIRDLLDIARRYKKTDIRSLEERVRQVDDSFLRMGGNLLINDYDEKEIKNIMEREMMLKAISNNLSQNLLKTVARLTPSFGLAGTVVSLIRMFKHFDSVETVAPMMAVALMSTFYGVIIANLFMMPLCAKLRERSIFSESLMSITIDGILAVKNMENPLKIEEKMLGFQEMGNFRSQELGKQMAGRKEYWQNLANPVKYLCRTIREGI